MKVNKYPKSRLPATKKICPHCFRFFHARGLHRHIQLVHHDSITKVIKVSRIPVAKETNRPSLPIITSENHPTSDNRCITVKKPEKDLLDKKGSTKGYKTEKECLEEIFTEICRFLESLQIIYCFGKSDLREELMQLSLKNSRVRVLSYTGIYELSVNMAWVSFRIHDVCAFFRVRELRVPGYPDNE